ncbi:CsbD family protein [Clostridium psychrophilum]|uniref:CsbD family protein n=1 Tax=Clostridium psychrophilum TaxID=132926 RepID=UPI001C0AB725|nr:CsbD family protein [Clostridium psychrophilum]MBU3182892.1 CsbD family protein [Clostridium psychrophilum]
MSNIRNKFDSEKDKFAGKTKETVGEATGSEETELNGKIQSQKGDIEEKIGNIKEKVAKKINDSINEKDE